MSGKGSEIASRIRLLCEQRGIPIGRLETDCELAHSYIRTMEKQGSVPAFERLDKIANYLDVSREFLISGDSSFKKANQDYFRVAPLFKMKNADAYLDMSLRIGEVIVAKSLCECGELLAFEVNDNDNTPKIEFGDKIIVEKTDFICSEDILVVKHCGKLKCRVYVPMDNDTILLMPMNRELLPDHFNAKTFEKSAEIIGRVIELRRSY